MRDSVVVSSPDSQSGGNEFNTGKRSTCSGHTKPANLQGSAQSQLQYCQMQPMSLYSILLMKLLSLSEVVRIERVNRVHWASASSACHTWVVRDDEEGGTG